MARLLLGEMLEQTVGVLLTMSLLGGPGRTKQTEFFKNIPCQNCWRVVLKKFAVWILCVGAGVLRHLSIICTFCILSFFLLGREQEFEVWMVIAEQKSELECWNYVHNNGSNVWLKHFNKTSYYKVTYFYFYAKVWVIEGRTQNLIRVIFKKSPVGVRI